MELRGASGPDPGEVALIYYVCDGPMVSLTDALGQQLKDSGGCALSGEARLGENRATFAKRLARRGARSNRARTGAPLFYVDAVIV
jgi:hypothetical protein